jgi:oxygen-independent coproporphyrinogen-3 oxidase
MKEGQVELGRLNQKYGVNIQQEFANAIRNQQAAGYLNLDGDTIKLTRKGLLQVDSLLPEYFEPQHRAVRYT